MEVLSALNQDALEVAAPRSCEGSEVEIIPVYFVLVEYQP
jgi:hypothetical protein